MRKTRVIKNCLLCGGLFEVQLSRIKNNRGKYCSKECSSRSLIGRKKFFSYSHCKNLSKVKHTKEWNKKVSMAQIGKIISIEQRLKISKTLTGRKRPREECINVSIGMKKSKAVQNHLKNLNQPGEKAPNWQGGLSYEIYPLGWNRTFKKQIRIKDKYKCKKCGISECKCYRKLDVHHIDYDKRNLTPLNLIALCHRCHMKTNFNREYWKEYFQSIINGEKYVMS